MGCSVSVGRGRGGVGLSGTAWSERCPVRRTASSGIVREGVGLGGAAGGSPDTPGSRGEVLLSVDRGAVEVEVDEEAVR